MLPTLDALRDFGRTVDKTFAPRKSRRDTVAALVAMLRRHDVNSLRKIVATIPAEAHDTEGAYSRLAKHIIGSGGKKTSEADDDDGLTKR